jgi:tRNA-specific 2-thiouridylase
MLEKPSTVNFSTNFIDRPRAVALYSGGLDSTLAILVMLRQGVDVTALTFLTHFGCDISDRSSCSKNPFKAAEQFGFTVKLCHLADKFIEIVKSPKYGHGKNMNPCIDCRILMLREAKEFMKLIGAQFVITGEVLGQRPMSQRRETFPLIDREAGLEGYVLRPLTALNLKPTIPEQTGLVKRGLLYGFKGRSRKPQMALAEEFGLKDYPTPAGGCLLTDPIYSYRLKELLEHTPEPSLKEINLLRIGRHFRLSRNCKVVVGRDEEENRAIQSIAQEGDILLKVEGFGSPLVLICGEPDETQLRLAASICARYSDAKRLPSVDVTVFRVGGEGRFRIRTIPASDTLLSSLRIEPKQRSEDGGQRSEEVTPSIPLTSRGGNNFPPS